MIYAVQCGGSGPIKLGITSKNPQRRLSQLQTSHHEPLTLLASQQVANDLEFEKSLHEMCADDRIRGEWFKPSDLVLEIVDQMRRGTAEVEGSRVYAGRIVAEYERQKRLADLCTALKLFQKLLHLQQREERIERKKRSDAQAREEWKRTRQLCVDKNRTTP